MGSALAKGHTGVGGEVLMISEKSDYFIYKSNVDVSGQKEGGTIRSLAKTSITSSGSLKANSDAKYGGKIDLTAENVQNYWHQTVKQKVTIKEEK